MYMPWRRLLVPVAKALGEVRAALDELRKSPSEHSDSFNAASTELDVAARDLGNTSVKQAGQGLRYFLVATPAMLGATGNVDSNKFVQTTGDEVEALRARLITNLSAARDHLIVAAPDVCLKLDVILKSLKEGLQDNAEAQAVEELDAIWTIFHDPILRFLSNGWRGLLGAKRVGVAMFLNALIISILGLPQWVLMMGMTWSSYNLFDVEDVLDDVTACFMALFGDSPHAKDPVGHVESISGIFLKRGIQVRAVWVCHQYAIQFRGQLLTLVKKFFGLGLVSLFKLLFFCLSFYAFCGALYGTCLITWWFSQLPVESRARTVVRTILQPYRILRDGVVWLLRLITLTFKILFWSPTLIRLPLYSYNHLDPGRREIRLLRVQKPGPFRTPTYDLVIFPFDSAPPYDAMSYRWEASCEPPCEECYLRLRTGRLSVGHKVHEFCGALAFTWSTRWLWIDAVCINQNHEAEKFNQIGMMGDIYRAAKRTLVWLDSDPSITLLDLTLMHLLNRHLVERGSMILNLGFGTPESRKRFANAIIMRMWKVRTRLLRQSYWSRGWIVQEVALAKTVVFIYGGQLFEWLSLIGSVATVHSDTYSHFAERHMEQISIAALEVEKGKSENGSLSRDILSRETKSQISALGIIQTTLKSHGRLDMAALLSMAMDRECSVNQDKVFCLLGLAKNPELYLGESEDTVQTTFYNTAKAVIPTHPDFILQCGGIGYPRKVTDLPSWVPDWSAVSTQEQNPILILPPIFSSTKEHKISEEVYHAGSLPFTAQKSHIAIHGSQLTIQAVRLSRIKKLSSACLKTFPNFLLNYDDVVAILPFQTELGDPYPHSTSEQSAEEAFARTLVGDRWWAVSDSSHTRTFPAPSSITKAFRHCRTMIAEEVSSNTASGVSDDELFYHVIPRPEQRQSEMLQEEYFLAVKYFQNLAVRGKRVGLSVDGHVCLVPQLTEVGDLIVIIEGLARPVMLRETEEGGWWLVGSAYVHGVMEGEVWEKEETVLHDFEIR